MPDLPHTMFQKWPRVLRHYVKTFLGTRPQLYFAIFEGRTGYEELLVDERTDICIEGFPRSANSFAVTAFEQMQTNPVQVAHHSHVAANAMRSAKYGIPTVVLIRNPKDAVISKTALDKEVQLVEQNATTPKQYIPFYQQVWAWNMFYRAIKPYQDRIVIAPFETVIHDWGEIIEQVNRIYGTNFVPFRHTEEALQSVKAHQGYHAMPSDRRSAIKSETRSDFEKAQSSSKTLNYVLREAQCIYNEVVDHRIKS